MIRSLIAVLLALTLLNIPATAKSSPATLVSTAKAGQLVDLTPHFVSFARENSALPDAALVAAFHARFDPFLPGFFNGKGDRQPRVDARIVEEMRALAKDSMKLEATAAAFTRQFRAGQNRFRRAFPDYRPAVPVYLVHSMRMMDGGTRRLADRYVLIFGADVIAREHDATTMGPFFDHEFFHVYHGGHFDPGCAQYWCGLWVERLAVYAAAQLTPGANDRQLLLLGGEKPLRADIDPRLTEAMCRARAKFESTEDADLEEAFNGGQSAGPFPRRYGYYLGYLLAAELGKTIPLAKLAKMTKEEVKPLLLQALDRYKCG